MSEVYCANCGHPCDSQCEKVRGFQVCSANCGASVKQMFEEGERAEREGRMTKYQIAAAALRNAPWRDTESCSRRVAEWASNNLVKKPELTKCAPRHVFEWATEMKYEDFDEMRQRVDDLGEAASIDLCNGRRWILQMMDWVATHMVINPNVCWRCAEPGHRTYGSLPVCDKCFKAVNAPTPVHPKEIEQVAARIRETMVGIPADGTCHADVCKQPRTKHTYYIRRAAGWLTHDGFTENQHDAQPYTRMEVDMLRVDGDEVIRRIR